MLATHLRHPPNHQILPWHDHVAKPNDIQPLPQVPTASIVWDILLVLPLHNLRLHLIQTPTTLDLNLKRLLLYTTSLAHTVI